MSGTSDRKGCLAILRRSVQVLDPWLAADSFFHAAGAAGTHCSLSQALRSADVAARHPQVPDPLIASYFGAVRVAEAPRGAAAAACAALDLGATPLVLLARDWTGLWHFLTVQALAAHRALRALGLDPNEPFRLLFADRPGTPPVCRGWCTHVRCLG